HYPLRSRIMRWPRSLPACQGYPIGRRRFLADLGLGFTGLALGAVLFEDGIARASEDADAKPAPPAKAKSVIWLFMVGGVSHLETFDPKPALHKYAGKTIAETPYESVLRASHLRKNMRHFVGAAQLETKILAPQVGFRKRGESGIEVSDWLPGLGDCVDDLAVIRSLWTTEFSHTAQQLFH